MRSEVFAAIVVILMAVSGEAGCFAGSLNTHTTTITATNTQTTNTSNSICVVSFATEQVTSNVCSCTWSDGTESCSLDLVNVGNAPATPSGACELSWGGDRHHGSYNPISSIAAGSSASGACKVAANGTEIPGSGSPITGSVNLTGSAVLLFNGVQS